MGLSDALNSLVSSLKGNTSAQQTGAANGASSASGSSGATVGVASSAVEEALGNQLANIEKEPESAKSIEEKANSALEDLMSKLGLSGSEEEETLGELKSVFAEEIEAREDDATVKDTDEVDETGEVDETDEGKSVDDILDEISDEDLQGLYDAIKDKLEFSPEEASAYVEGEAEVKARIEEAVENNPDMEPAEIEEQIRAAYELENPEYADAKKEADAVMEKYDKAMDEEYNAYCEENPQPALEDFDSPEEYAKALGEWASDAGKHMNEAEHNYLKENENYRNLKFAEMKSKFKNLPYELDKKPILKNPEDPGFKKILPDDGIDLDPGFSKILPDDGIDLDPGFSKIISDSDYKLEFVPEGDGAEVIKQMMIDDGVLPGEGSGYIDYAGYLKTLVD